MSIAIEIHQQNTSKPKLKDLCLPLPHLFFHTTFQLLETWGYGVLWVASPQKLHRSLDVFRSLCDVPDDDVPIKPMQPTSMSTQCLLYSALALSYKVCPLIFLSIRISSSSTTCLDVSDIRNSCSRLANPLWGDGKQLCDLLHLWKQTYICLLCLSSSSPSSLLSNILFEITLKSINASAACPSFRLWSLLCHILVRQAI